MGLIQLRDAWAALARLSLCMPHTLVKPGRFRALQLAPSSGRLPRGACGQMHALRMYCIVRASIQSLPCCTADLLQPLAATTEEFW